MSSNACDKCQFDTEEYAPQIAAVIKRGFRILVQREASGRVAHDDPGKNLCMRWTYFPLIFLFLSACQVSRPTPEEALRARLDSVLTHVCQVYDLPGLAVGVIKGDQVVYARGFGLRKLGTSNLVNARPGHQPSCIG